MIWENFLLKKLNSFGRVLLFLQRKWLHNPGVRARSLICSWFEEAPLIFSLTRLICLNVVPWLMSLLGQFRLVLGVLFLYSKRIRHVDDSSSFSDKNMIKSQCSNFYSNDTFMLEWRVHLLAWKRQENTPSLHLLRSFAIYGTVGMTIEDVVLNFL